MDTLCSQGHRHSGSSIPIMVDICLTRTAAVSTLSSHYHLRSFCINSISRDNSIISSRKFTFCSHAKQKQTESTSQDKNVVIQKLIDTAMQDECCGKFSLVEKSIFSGLKKEIAIYAGTTNIVRYCDFSSSKGFGNIKWAGKRERKEINVKGKGCSVARHEDEIVKKLKVC